MTGPIPPDNDERIARLRKAWARGGSAQPLIEELIRVRRMDEAGALARLALADDDCPDREAIERLLAQTGCPPPGWLEAVTLFSREPTLENWDRLMCFTPDHVYYQRTRNTLRLLRQLGTDPDALFRCATRYGTTPDAIELAKSGEVHPDTIVVRGREAPPGVRGFWFGLAAEAAFARGDDLGTVRLLKLAYSENNDMLEPEISAREIRKDAGPELQEALDRIGVPRFD